MEYYFEGENIDNIIIFVRCRIGIVSCDYSYNIYSSEVG